MSIKLMLNTMPTIPELYSTLKSRKGFTLIELLVVISIIAILVTLVTATFGTAQQKARDSERKTDLDALQTALEIFKSDTKGAAKYPSSIYLNVTASDPLVLEYGNYIKETPTDPSITDVNSGKYIYSPLEKDGSDCSSTALTTTAATAGRCVNYKLSACIENENDSDIDDLLTIDEDCKLAGYQSYSLSAP